MEPAGDLLAAAGDEARAGVVVSQEVVPERHPVFGVGDAVVEQFADEPAPLGRIRIGDERLDAVGGRQEADKVEARAADERAIVGPRRTRDAPLPPQGVDDPVDGVLAAILGRRQVDLPQGELRLPARALEGEARLPGRFRLDPLFQHGDGFGRQRVALARHPIVGVGARDTGDDLARVSQGFDEAGRARVAPGERGLAGVHRKAPLPGIAGVTLAAVHPQDGHDIMGEVNGVCPSRHTERKQNKAKMPAGVRRRNGTSLDAANLEDSVQMLLSPATIPGADLRVIAAGTGHRSCFHGRAWRRRGRALRPH